MLAGAAAAADMNKRVDSVASFIVYALKMVEVDTVLVNRNVLQRGDYIHILARRHNQFTAVHLHTGPSPRPMPSLSHILGLH